MLPPSQAVSNAILYTHYTPEQMTGQLQQGTSLYVTILIRFDRVPRCDLAKPSRGRDQVILRVGSQVASSKCILFPTSLIVQLAFRFRCFRISHSPLLTSHSPLKWSIAQSLMETPCQATLWNLNDSRQLSFQLEKRDC